MFYNLLNNNDPNKLNKF